MFFKDISEFKQYRSTNISADFNDLQIYLKQADIEFLIKNIGSTFFNYLQAIYTANQANYNAIPTNDKNAIEKLRYASAAYAIYLWIPEGQLQIDSSGIRIANTENLKTAFPWQIRDLKRSVLRTANVHMEEALNYFSENKAIYTQYASAPEFNLFNNTFIKTAFEFTSYFSQLDNSRLKFIKLKPIIAKVEDNEIQPVLFSTLYNALKARVASDTTTANDKLILPYIKSAVANLTVARATKELTVGMDENGFIEFDNIGLDEVTGGTKSATERINKLASIYENDGMGALAKLRDYLEANKANYAEYTSDPSYTTYDSKSFTNKSANGFFFGG